MASLSENVGHFIPGVAPLLEEKDAKKKERNEWIRFAASLGLSALLHPLEYTKTLIRLGYEPLPPARGKTLLGQEVLLLPNIFQYANYIRKVDGFWGCYTGVGPQLTGLLLAKLVNKYMVSKKGFKRGILTSPNTQDFEQFKEELRDEIILCATGAMIIHPFHLISVRMMAQFVGHENIYTNIWTSAREIFQTEGLLGFFNGLMPRLIWDLGTLILTASTIFMLNKYIIKDKVKKQFSMGIVQYAYTSMLHPFYVTSTCMLVSGSRLAAALPPTMPFYTNWLYCMMDLSRRGELKRGSSILVRPTVKSMYQPRTYSSPQNMIESSRF